MDLEFDEIVWGFVVSRGHRRPAAYDERWLFIVAPELSAQDHTPVQFCRVLTRGSTNAPPQTIFVLTLGALPSDDAGREVVRGALLRDRPSAYIAVPRADRVGFAEIESVPPSRTELVAAAVAVSKANGAWDESDPFLIVVGLEKFQVRAAVVGSRWHAVVEPG